MNKSVLLLDELETLGIVAGTTGKDFSGTDFRKDIEKLLSFLNLDVEAIAQLRQVHEDQTQMVKAKSDFCEVGDSIITALEDVILFIRTADCFPIFLVDVQNRVIALVHAGWRSAKKMLLAKTIEKMCDNYGSSIEALMMFVGPGLQREAFEVQEDFLANDSFMPYIDQENGKYLFDLNQYLQDEAMSCGIDPENILDLAICTKQNNDLFYSYRNGDGEKRNYSFICIKSL